MSNKPTRGWYRSPSGRWHTSNMCTGGAPKARMKKVKAPTPAEAQQLLDSRSPERSDLCRCAWRAAHRIIEANTQNTNERSS